MTRVRETSDNDLPLVDRRARSGTVLRILLLALVLIVAPHVVGAPLPPEGEHALAPLPLERQFIVAATITSFVFWALLGTLSAFFLKRFQSA